MHFSARTLVLCCSPRVDLSTTSVLNLEASLQNVDLIYIASTLRRGWLFLTDEQSTRTAPSSKVQHRYGVPWLGGLNRFTLLNGV